MMTTSSSKRLGRSNRRRMIRERAAAFKKASSSKKKKPSPSDSEPKHRKSDRESYAFVPTEKDLESDEAVWDLYKRWVLFHELERTPEEMQSRFIHFKVRATEVAEANKKSRDAQLLSYFADMSKEEFANFNFGFWEGPLPRSKKKK